MHPVDMIFFWARSNPEHPAFIQPDMIVTYRELAEAIESVSERIAHYDFNKKETVAVSIDQPIKKLAVCFALLRRGISVALVNQRTLPHLRTSGINDVIYTGEGLMLSGGRNIRFEDSWFKARDGASVLRSAVPESAAEQANVIFFISGDAGIPKKMIVPSDALMAGVGTLPLTGEADCDKILIVASVNSPSGFDRAALTLYSGKTVCFAGNYDAQLLLINAFDVDTLDCSMQQASDLVSMLEKNSEYRLESLEEVWIDGGSFTKDLIGRIQTRLCRNVITGYSSVEAGCIGFANFDMIAGVPDAIGFVGPHVNVEIVDDDDVPLAVGEEGRVRCRSEYFSRVFAANNPVRVDEAGNAWCYPGDYGRLTGDGIICISRARTG